MLYQIVPILMRRPCRSESVQHRTLIGVVPYTLPGACVGQPTISTSVCYTERTREQIKTTYMILKRYLDTQIYCNLIHWEKEKDE